MTRRIKRNTEVNIVKILFKSYYRNCELVIPEIQFREIALQTFDDEVMIRHLAFKSVEELRKYISLKIPAHLYYSTAYYENPDVQDMDQKGWLGADLVFDIDADHLDTDNCRNVIDLGNGRKLITKKCLEDALNETIKLIDVLENEFGFSNHELKIVFSGSRGFHVHIESKIVQNLNQEERRELIDYLLCHGFKIEKFIDKKGRPLFSPKLPGIGKRIGDIVLKIFDNEDLRNRIFTFRKITKKWLSRIQNNLDVIINSLKVRIDEIVTLDTKRLIRVPGSIHGKTGLKVTLLNKNDLEKGIDEVLKKSIIFRKGFMKIQLGICKEVEIFDYKIDCNQEVIKVPTYIGVYLIRQGIAHIYDNG